MVGRLRSDQGLGWAVNCPVQLPLLSKSRARGLLSLDGGFRNTPDCVFLFYGYFRRKITFFSSVVKLFDGLATIKTHFPNVLFH